MSGEMKPDGRENERQAIVGVNLPPPGLLREITRFIYGFSIKQVEEMSLAPSISLLSAVCGRHYNTPTGLGLNTYIAVVSETGTGKGIMEKGIMALMSSVEKLFAFRVYVRF